jgi:Cu-Zn family superoxide dismutase
MKLRRLLLALAVLSLAVPAQIVSAQEAGPTLAIAELKTPGNKTVGLAIFSTLPTGEVRIRVTVTGLAKGTPGPHGIHIHAVGACSPDFGAAGAHFNPGGAKKHGFNNPKGPHAGDLPNIVFDAGGNAVYETTTNRITLSPSLNSIFDADGSALIITAQADDYVSNPSGNSGARIACGVILPAGASNGVHPVVVNTPQGRVTFDNCPGICGANSADPSKIGPIRDWQTITFTGQGIQTVFLGWDGNPVNYSGTPYTVCFSFTAAASAAAGGSSHLKVAYWAAKPKDAAGNKGRWYVLLTTYTAANEACASLRLPATFALVQQP